MFLKNLILDSVPALFGPKTSNEERSITLILNFAQNNQKTSEYRLFIKLEKPHFGPILGPFSSEIPPKKIFSKKIRLILSFYVAVT